MEHCLYFILFEDEEGKKNLTIDCSSKNIFDEEVVRFSTHGKKFLRAEFFDGSTSEIPKKKNVENARKTLLAEKIMTSIMKSPSLNFRM